jgi:saccharopine dehydrogenase-like NADP-dependent oxidoreductase
MVRMDTRIPLNSVAAYIGRTEVAASGRAVSRHSPIDGGQLAILHQARDHDVRNAIASGVDRGHRELIAFLMNELRLNSRRDLLKNILENAIPITPQDVVLIFCTVTGWKDGHLTQVTDARKIYHGEFMGMNCSAIQLTTASSLCAVLDLHATGKLPKKGFVRQEQVKLGDFLGNRFGKVYDRNMKDLSWQDTRV